MVFFKHCNTHTHTPVAVWSDLFYDRFLPSLKSLGITEIKEIDTLPDWKGGVLQLVIGWVTLLNRQFLTNRQTALESISQSQDGVQSIGLGAFKGMLRP